MPVAALPVFWTAAATAAGATASAAIGAHSASNAAKTQMQTANYAADQQKKAADDQLAYQRQQAENTYRQQEADRKANYDQWAARQSRLNSIGAALGYGAGTTIPAYVPIADPGYTTGSTPLPPTGMAGQARTTVNPQQAAAIQARRNSIAAGLGY